MEHFNRFVFSINNRLQHMPASDRTKMLQKILADLADTYTFTPVNLMCEENEDEEMELIDCENEIERERRIRKLQAHYGTFGDDEDGDEEEQTRQHAVKTRCGNNDLHEAVLMNDLVLIRTLVAQGQDPNEKNNDGHSPVFLAYLEENNSIIDLFKELGVIS